MWLEFPFFASVAICCWLGASALFFTSGKKVMNQMAAGLSLAGTLVLLAFVINLWIHIQRPPMRTLGETRLWYAIFLSGIGLVSYLRWKYKWLVSYSLGLAIVFLIINLQHPETYDKTLMPALQSPWFIPHVIVYIFAYALLGASSVVALRDGQRLWHHTDAARLDMRRFSDAFLDDYLERAGAAVLSSVGAYQLEGLGAQLFRAVEGDHFTILGLPLLPLLDFLRENGVLIP